MPPIQGTGPASTGALDSAPPMPPSQGGQASMGQMAGDQSQQPGGGGGATQVALERLMLAEKSLRDAAGLVPGLAPVIDATISTLRSGAAKVLMSSQGAPGQAPASPPQGSMGAMAGGMTPGAAA